MEARNPIRELRLAKGWSLQQLADAVGASKSQIDKLEKGARRLTVDWMVRLAGPLGIDPRDLVPAATQGRGAEGRKSRAAKTGAPGGAGALLHKIHPAYPPVHARACGQTRTIPVLSAARGGRDQEMFLTDGPIDRAPCPPYLLHVKDAYAIYVTGSSMVPMYRPRQLLFVHPHRPPAPGCGIVIVKKNGAVLIKEFVRRTKTALAVREYSPARRDFSIPLEEIEAAHAVAGAQEPA